MFVNLPLASPLFSIILCQPLKIKISFHISSTQLINHYTDQILLSNSSNFSLKFPLKFFFSEIIQSNIKIVHLIAVFDFITQFARKMYNLISKKSNWFVDFW